MICDFDSDKPREECGVFGVFGHPDAAILTALGLHALQHRGEESCGITTFTGRFHHERHLGLVGDNFTGPDLAERLPGEMAIGHNRYSTQGKTALRNIQPIYGDMDFGGFAIAHNGNLTNARLIRRELTERGALFQSTMDTEVFIHLVAQSKKKPRLVDRLIDAMQQVEGGYALVAMSGKKLIGARDPIGLRPLMLGKLGDAWVLASETCAIDSVGATFVREVENGEMVVISEDGIESFRAFPEQKERPCIFEYVYFSRPDSKLNGHSVYDVRRRMGRELARETFLDRGLEADVIVPVPDSGVPAAIGFAEESGLPFQLGIIRNHYVGRTFILPTQDGRKLSVSKKHAPNRPVLDGKRVVLVDDSIVRGNTSEKIVEMVKRAGAREVHFRSASPPIKFPDFYGIDMPDQEELISAVRTHEEITASLKVDSLGFLSVDGLYRAICGQSRDDSSKLYADHCFTGDYPTRLTDHERKESAKERQLSFLEDH